MRSYLLLVTTLCSTSALLSAPVGADDDSVKEANSRLAHLNDSNPWYPDKNFPKLTTPQWVGDEGVECVVVLAIDDMRDSAKYEQYLRPILNRLKKIDGRAPVSIMACNVKPEDVQLQSWLDEGVSIECHTVDHPCPLLQGGDFDKAKSTYDRCIDLLNKIPGNKPVAFRTPCCDSLNTVSPRFYSAIFPRTTKDGNERFWKYKVNNLKRGETVHKKFVNYITNYPYPYVINNSCWQFPCVAPSDWCAQHLHGVNNPKTIEDWKACLDICVLKQGTFNLVFHPHGWITAEQVNEFIEYAVAKHGKTVKFLNFREVADRLNATFGSTPLRDAVDDIVAKAAHSEFRSLHTASTDLQTAPNQILNVLASGRRKQLLPLRRADGSHNGVFIRDDHVCWINEDTANRVDLIHRVSFEDIEAMEEREVARKNQPPVLIGAAVVDITPDVPVRLTGYGNRTEEATGVASKIHARALVIGGSTPKVADSVVPTLRSNHGANQQRPLTILITVDNCGVPASVTQDVFENVAAKLNIPRERFSISSTHTHSGPWLRDFAPNIFASLPDDHAAHLKQYEDRLIQQLAEVVDTAVAARRPGHLSLAFGELKFAMNRRTLNNGQWTGFGDVPDGPTDQRFPLLSAHDTDGKLIAVLANYACHATTETGQLNQISGDWPGIAASLLEKRLPGAVALIAIGCGADANPSPRGTHELSQQHGRTVADEVQRLMKSDALRINPSINCSLRSVDLPLGPVPGRDELEQVRDDPGVVGSRARYFLKMLDDGKPIPTIVPNYPVQTWCFGKDLAMVFLAGEVVVDYSIRLNEMFESDRLWINAYSNDVPCYIASKRILREGGYEADSSMRYYRQPTRLAPEVEDVICDTVQKLLPHDFYSEALKANFPAPKMPEESLSAITVRPGLKVELVAAEPLISDPVAFDWDTNGRLWVVEMGTYPAGMPRQAMALGDGSLRGTGNAPSSMDEREAVEQDRTTTGRVRVLEDSDGDGQCDRAATFLDGLSYPTGLHPWRNGWLITCAPDIIYAQDTDGDLVADKQTVLFTGFTEGNQQHRVNGLRWGLDGWLYLANGDSGGEVRSVRSVLNLDSEMPGKPINVRGRDIRIHPDTGAIETLSGQTQFGRERDDFDNWFGNNNSNPIWHYVQEERYLRRNPHATGLQTKVQIAEFPGAAPVFPASKTLARFNDFHAVNRFTSACSTSIYRDGLLGEEFYGNAFTCEPVHNLVSRLVLKRDGATFAARRANDERDSEFFASSDNWTRPVMVRTGPDGALYIADMYRQVIEHPQWIPAEYQRKLNLYAGHTMGRIFRVVRSNADTVAYRSAIKTLDCGAIHDTRCSDDSKRHDVATPEKIVELMSSSNGWWRDTAQRLLLHQPRNDNAVNRIVELMTSDTNPAVRVQSMWTLSQVDEPIDDNASLFAQAFNDPAAEVRRAAIEVLGSGGAGSKNEISRNLAKLSNDSSAVVRQQLALSLGNSAEARAAQTLAQLLIKDGDSPHIVSAVMTSLTPENVATVLQQVMQTPYVDDHSVVMLIAQAAAMKQTESLAAPFQSVLNRLNNDDADIPADTWKSASLVMNSIARHSTVDQVLRVDSDIAAAITRAKQAALKLLNQTQQPLGIRTAVLDFLAVAGLSDSEAREYLLPLISPTLSVELQHSAVTAIGRSSRTALATLFDQWPQITPAVRTAIVDQFLLSTARSNELLDAVAAKQLTLSDFDAAARDRLLNHGDNDLKIRAKQLLGNMEVSARHTIVETHQSQLEELSGDSTAGKLVFEKRCATCHELQNIGKAIGADLSALKDRSTSAMLTAILDPNKAVEAKYLTFTAVTTQGLSYSGMLVSETGNSVTLLATDGKQKVVSRADLESLQCANRSLMPEGLEKDLSPQDLADVIAFVQVSGIKWKSFAGNAPEPISADANGRLTLPAAKAEIYGPNLVFESKHGNIGFWQSTDDYAVWNIDIPNSGLWTVEIDYACDSQTAGNVLKLSTGTRLLSARVPGTGTWKQYKTWTLGKIDLGRGRRRLTVTAPEKPTFALVDLRTIRLIPPE